VAVAVEEVEEVATVVEVEVIPEDDVPAGPVEQASVQRSEMAANEAPR